MPIVHGAQSPLQLTAVVGQEREYDGFVGVEGRLAPVGDAGPAYETRGFLREVIGTSVMCEPSVAWRIAVPWRRGLFGPAHTRARNHAAMRHGTIRQMKRVYSTVDGRGSVFPLRDWVAMGRVTWRWRLAQYWQARDDLDEAARHTDRALHLLRRRSSAPVALVADIMLAGARIARDRDDYPGWHDRLTAVVGLLESAPSTPGRDRLLTLALIGLAESYRRAGHYSDATATLDRARHLADAATRPDPATQAALLAMRGIIAKELGDFDRAAQLYTEVGRIIDEHGLALANAVALERNRAGLANARRQYQRGEEHARRAVALRQRQTPKANPVELAAEIAVLGAALAGQQRHAEARDCLQRAMAACQAARPPRRYQLTEHLHAMAGIAHQEGNLDEAERLYRRAMNLRERILGRDHPDVARVANGLGTLLHDQNRHTDAASCYRRALAIAEHRYPPQHPVTLALRANLARVTANP